MNNDTITKDLQDLPDACASFSARRLARVLSNRYDKALVPVGISSAQFGLLAALNKCGEAQMLQLADLLGLERTTLTRNLAVLQKGDLVNIAKGEGDGRMRIISITPAGKQRLIQALPLWRDIQKKVGAESIVRTLHEITVAKE